MSLLEARRYRDVEGADPRIVATVMESVGVKTSYGGVIGSPEVGITDRAVRPEVLQHLSYCYELVGRWTDALACWRDYCRQFSASDRVKSRLEYLAARAG
jgi:hypothetical protein